MARLFLSLAITVAGALLTFAVHRPQVGMDDANITQAYANNIAGGYGYVYNRGGERVEGSTSLAWTMINVAAFLVARNPEGLLAVVTFFLTVLAIVESLRLSARLHEWCETPAGLAGPLCAVGFLISPAFFTWSVWSLMDTPLWIYCVALATVRLATMVTSAHTSARWSNGFLAAVLALPLVRPEGALLSGVLLAFASAHAAVHGLARPWRLAAAWLMWAGVIAGTFAFRMLYFGVPFPNTFYAKVSTGLASQARAGAIYVMTYVLQPALLPIALAALLTVLLLARRSRTSAWWLAALFVTVAGTIAATYVAVGGDHFGAFRQMQVLTPIIIALASVTVTRVIVRWLEPPRRRLTWAAVAVVGLFALAPLAAYVRNRAVVDFEFRIAESGRQVGRQLNALTPRPSVAVISSGGIARTYTGHIYDLMGLNWVEMAHAVRDKTGGVRSQPVSARTSSTAPCPTSCCPGRERAPRRPDSSISTCS